MKIQSKFAVAAVAALAMAPALARTVLVSPNGIIIAIDPSAAEVEEMLEKLLGQ